jgi:hypothetical protein
VLRKNPAARLIVTLLATAAFLQPANAQTAPLRPPAATEDAVRLSAFEVSISRDVGYPSANAAEASRTTIPIEHLRGRFRGTLFDRYTFGRSAMPGLSLSLGSVSMSACALTNISARNEPSWGLLPACWRFDAIAGYRVTVASRPANCSRQVSNLLERRDISYVTLWFSYTIDAAARGRRWPASCSDPRPLPPPHNAG